MKHNFSKTMPLLLSALLIAQTACGSAATPDSPDNETTSATGTGSVTAELEYTPSAQNFNGYEFNMLVPLDPIYYTSEAATGDIVNDAVYNINVAVEDLFNVKLNYLEMDAGWGGREQFMTVVRSSILADDDAYDVVFPAYYYGEVLAQEGNFYDFKLIDSIHLDEAWWIDGFNDQAEIYGKLLGAVGDYGLSNLNNQIVLYYNKRIHGDYKLDNIYTLVRENKWTFDALLSMIKGVGKDLNGNELLDEEDQLGFVANTNSARAFTVNFGIKFAEKDKSGEPQITFKNERTFEVYDRLFELMNKSNDALYIADASVMYKAFMNCRTLFMGTELAKASLMREMNDDFGIVPMPKYDEAQASYITYSTGPSLQAIPCNADDPERTGAVLDALNYYTHRDVIPAYYELALKSKYARDYDTAEMLDIISDGIYYDFGFIYGTLLNGIADIFGNSLVQSKNDNFSSYYASREEANNEKLKIFIETFKALK